jgi:hypothetical protein
MEWKAQDFGMTVKTAVLVTVALALASCSKSADERPLDLYVFDEQFNGLVSFFLNDEARDFVKGRDNSLIKILGLVNTTATHANATYANDRPTGDRMFLGNAALLTGRIASINRESPGAPYLVFRDSGAKGTEAHLASKLSAEVRTLKPGQNITLVCNGKGAVAGTPIFAECQRATVVAAEVRHRLAQEIESFSEGEAVPPAAVEIAVRLESMARTVDDAAACSRRCDRQVNTVQADTALGGIVDAMRNGRLKIDSETGERIKRRGVTTG